MLPEIPALFPNLSLWAYLLIYTLSAQMTIMSVSLYLHRYLTHRSIEEMHSVLRYFFSAWVFLTTGMLGQEWAPIHLKHHAKVETKDDPHSPKVYGLAMVFWGGAFLYRKAAKDKESLRAYSYGVRSNWIERNLYAKCSFAGVVTFFLIESLLFGWAGVVMWMAHIPVIAIFGQGFINGIGHAWGYRNYDTPDQSRNILPLGIFAVGEELHNNHHRHQRSARFSCGVFVLKIGLLRIRIPEIDVGWLYIRAFQRVGLIGKVHVYP